MLAVAADKVALWGGTPERVTEESGNGFPLVRSYDTPGPERREQIDDTLAELDGARGRQEFAAVLRH